jgi:hypothetical protein
LPLLAAIHEAEVDALEATARGYRALTEGAGGLKDRYPEYAVYLDAFGAKR